MTAHRFDVVALGEPLIEFNQVRSGEATYLRGFGGDTSNAVVAAARAGARTAYLTRLGCDEFGDAIRHMLQSEGVDTQFIVRDPDAPTGLYFVSHTDAGHQFTYRRAGSAASLMTPQELPRQAVQKSRYLHVSGISMALSVSACDTVFAAMQIAREAGAQVCLDANLRLRLWTLARARQCLTEGLHLCDLFVPSEEDLQTLTDLRQPEQLLSWSHAQGARLVVLKRGAQGCWVSDGTQVRVLPGHAVPVQDATGAGDCFSGNLLARLATGDDIFTAARYANAAAALAVQGWGAVAPLPRPDAVRALLASE